MTLTGSRHDLSLTRSAQLGRCGDQSGPTVGTAIHSQNLGFHFHRLTCVAPFRRTWSAPALGGDRDGVVAGAAGRPACCGAMRTGSCTVLMLAPREVRIGTGRWCPC
nr:hypothetical protein GCM10020093_019610 [Planobispora longispora]